jgi:hypothetical protein
MSNPQLDTAGVRGGLEAVERDREDKPPFYLTLTEVKLLGISGVCLIGMLGPPQVHCC